jgi:hypothetical protein
MKDGKQVPDCKKEDVTPSDFINKLSKSGLFSDAELEKMGEID